MGEIRIGTASWADKELIESGLFYPPEANTPEGRLRYYASRFPCVEVDSSYYGIPAYNTAAVWAERTPDDFIFDVKAFRLFTMHQTPYEVLPRDIREALGAPGGKKNIYYKDLPEEIKKEMWQRFLYALEPLKGSGKLGYLLLQFPPWFHPTRENIDYILHCADVLTDYTVAVEFRQANWFSERSQGRTLSLLKENGLTMVIVDEPQGTKSSVPFLPVVTNPELAAVRMHGRNIEMWMARGLASSTERFNYLYSEDELRTFVEPFRTLGEEVEEVRVYFNNNRSNYAQVNAQQMSELLNEG